MSAAPLKPAVGSSGTGVFAIPHSNECGPIEAAVPGLVAGPLAVFRTRMSAAPLKPPARVVRLKDAGGLFRTRMSAAPLKLGSPTTTLGDSWAIPHSNECGPIEAAVRIVATVRAAVFRTRMSAAPLKQGDPGARHERRDSYSALE